MRQDAVQKIAFVNFGGIGDEILFSPVIEEVKKKLPHAHITLFLEERSQSVRDILPYLDSVIALEIQNQPKWKAFFQLWNLLRNKYFDAVISSGSNPMIPVLLWLSGIPIRIGFGTGKTSRQFLTAEAYLAPKENRAGYAADMYFTLASSFLTWLFKDQYTPPEPPVLPHLKPMSTSDLSWAAEKLQPHAPGRKILIHPGVSTISVQKNILKSWPASSWAKLIEQLSQEGNAVFLIGGPDDREAVETIRKQLPSHLPHFTDLYGQTKNLKQLSALIQTADLLIGVDSSPMHIAVGYQKPTVAMFGPTDEKKLLPPNDPRFQAVTVSDLSCRPCLWDVRAESCDQPICLDVPVEAMLHAVHRILDRPIENPERNLVQ